MKFQRLLLTRELKKAAQGQGVCKEGNKRDAHKDIYEQTVNERFFQNFTKKSEKCEKMKIIFKNGRKFMKFL